MCLMLYIATDAPVPAGAFGQLTIEAVGDEQAAELRTVFSRPAIRYVGVNGSCSCDFRHVLAEQPSDCYGHLLELEDAAKSAQSTAVLQQLIDLLSDRLQASGSVEIFPTWAGMPVRGTASTVLRAAEIRPERFFFAEGCLYTLLP